MNRQKHRSPSLSFAVVFCTVAACCIPLAARWYTAALAADGAQSSTKADVIEHIEKLKGEVRIDGEHPDEPVWMVDLSAGELDEQILDLLKHLPKLEVLILNELPVTDHHLVAIGRLKSLHELSLDGTQITDAGLKSLRTLNELDSLSINRTLVTNAGLKHLAALRRLKDLSYFETEITGEAVKAEFMGRIKMIPTDSPVVDRGDPSKLPRPEPMMEQEDEHLAVDPAEELAENQHAQGVALFLASRQSGKDRLRAWDLLEAAVANDPSNVTFRIDLADACVLSRNPLAMALACELYDEVLSEVPDDDAARARLVDAYIALKNYDAARDVMVRRIPDDPSTLFQMSLIAIASGDYDRGANALRKVKHPLAVSLAEGVAALKPGLRSSDSTVTSLPPGPRRQPLADRDVWQNLMETFQHYEKVSSTASAVDVEVEDRPQLSELIEELNHCLTAVELTRSQIRFYAPKLDLGVGSEVLIDEMALVTSREFPVDALVIDGSRFRRWQSLATICLWRAINDAVHEVATADRGFAAGIVATVSEKLIVNQSLEEQVLADRFGAVAHLVETASSDSARTTARLTLRDLQAHSERRRRQYGKLRVALAFLHRSMAATHRSEFDIGGCQMLLMFKMQPQLGFVSAGGAVWLDSVENENLWLRSEELARTLPRPVAAENRSPASRQQPRTKLLLELAGRFAAVERNDSSTAWLKRIKGEFGLKSASGADGADIASWLLQEMRRYAVQIADGDRENNRLLWEGNFSLDR